jgi:hypothetical protein
MMGGDMLPLGGVSEGGHGMRSSSMRVIVAMALALATGILAAQPVAAARHLYTTGDIGSFDEFNFRDYDDGPYGANCIYETGSSDDLERITVRAPINVHGLATHPNWSKVEWRFKIRRNSPGPGTFQTIFTSSWQTDLANDQYVADDFTRRPWIAPANPSGFYQVLIEVRFWKQGSVHGFTRWQYEWYKAKRGSGVYENNEYCFAEYVI